MSASLIACLPEAEVEACMTRSSTFAIGAFVVSLVAVVPIASGQVLPSSNGGPILRCGNAMV